MAFSPVAVVAFANFELCLDGLQTKWMRPSKMGVA